MWEPTDSITINITASAADWNHLVALWREGVYRIVSSPIGQVLEQATAQEKAKSAKQNKPHVVGEEQLQFEGIEGVRSAGS